jgi:bacteriocin-like protein
MTNSKNVTDPKNIKIDELADDELNKVSGGDGDGTQTGGGGGKGTGGGKKHWWTGGDDGNSSSNIA